MVVFCHPCCLLIPYLGAIPSVVHRLVQRELKYSGVACHQCVMEQYWTCPKPKELTFKAGG